VNGLKRPDSATLMVTHYKARTWVQWGQLDALRKPGRRIILAKQEVLMSDSINHRRMLAYIMH
jgi:hypothetical protein